MKEFFGLISILIVMLAIWVVSSKIEADSYERLTGKHVSTWDAMFLDLRIQESVR